MSEEKETSVWVVFVHTILKDIQKAVPVFFCYKRATARRLAKGCNMLGADGIVRQKKAVETDDGVFVQFSKDAIELPTEEDMIIEELDDKQKMRDELIAKARTVLTAEELEILFHKDS